MEYNCASFDTKYGLVTLFSGCNRETTRLKPRLHMAQFKRARGQYLERFVRLTNSLGPRYLRFEYLESFVI